MLQEIILLYHMIIIENWKITEIENAHNKSITIFSHCFDNLNKRDLILSVSSFDNII